MLKFSLKIILKVSKKGKREVSAKSVY